MDFRTTPKNFQISLFSRGGRGSRRIQKIPYFYFLIRGRREGVQENKENFFIEPLFYGFPKLLFMNSALLERNNDGNTIFSLIFTRVRGHVTISSSDRYLSVSIIASSRSSPFWSFRFSQADVTCVTVHFLNVSIERWCGWWDPEHWPLLLSTMSRVRDWCTGHLYLLTNFNQTITFSKRSFHKY